MVIQASRRHGGHGCGGGGDPRAVRNLRSPGPGEGRRGRRGSVMPRGLALAAGWDGAPWGWGEEEKTVFPSLWTGWCAAVCRTSGGVQ